MSVGCHWFILKPCNIATVQWLPFTYYLLSVQSTALVQLFHPSCIWKARYFLSTLSWFHIGTSPSLLSVVWALSVRDMVVSPLLQHESGWQLGPHYCHGAGPELQLEDDTVGIWDGLCGVLRCLSAAHQEWAQGGGAAEYRDSSQEDQRRWEWFLLDDF